ncbi:hypothetical protein [Streptosporangium carneum]|uniref:Uncharacterized protein n=1 Tax=Streptosporangium carneum TaxID=47481 RepID=A0A9W6HYT1_9ACTN|nr:hypothetical protein [Streptosporangium carneum]GLK08852.1 hypothetical protein GCM10017600_22570 [Streptosporangium carneum]
MTLLRRHISPNNGLVSILALPAAVLMVVGLGWAALHFLFGPDVRRVDPAVLSELRAVGRVVGEDGGIAHEWENSYVEFKYLVVHLDGSATEDVVAETERRLSRSGWRVWQRQRHEIDLASARWTSTLVEVEQLEWAGHMSSELREAVAATGLPMSEMVYITIQA